MPNATVPVLRDAAAELRAKRSAVSRFERHHSRARAESASVTQLAERNAATFDRISQTQANVAQTEAQIQSIIDDFAKVSSSLRALWYVDLCR